MKVTHVVVSMPVTQFVRRGVGRRSECLWESESERRRARGCNDAVAVLSGTAWCVARCVAQIGIRRAFVCSPG